MDTFANRLNDTITLCYFTHATSCPKWINSRKYYPESDRNKLNYHQELVLEHNYIPLWFIQTSWAFLPVALWNNNTSIDVQPFTSIIPSLVQYHCFSIPLSSSQCFMGRLYVGGSYSEQSTVPLRSPCPANVCWKRESNEKKQRTKSIRNYSYPVYLSLSVALSSLE